MAPDSPNVYNLASTNSPSLLPLLHARPSLAHTRDPTGYSLLHAAASYSHPSLLRALLSPPFDVNPNELLDEDGETALFVVETLDCARVLVEDGHVDVQLKNGEGKMASERLEEEQEGEWREVVRYLREAEGEGSRGVNDDSSSISADLLRAPPPLPPNVHINVGTMDDPASAPREGEDPSLPDPAFRKRIEELAAREDFKDEDAQRELRDLITEAVRGVTEGQGDDGGRGTRRKVGEGLPSPTKTSTLSVL
ncbi:MAG: hypothetical protein M1817_001667 [Caeruleum heppii]|nr:MAG: hypothetical protein M1817_001667 [Caeruleum heppii]